MNKQRYIVSLYLIYHICQTQGYASCSDRKYLFVSRIAGIRPFKTFGQQQPLLTEAVYQSFRSLLK